MPIYFWAFAVALVVSFLVMPLVILLARRTGAMDAPNARKVHKKPVPRIGGLGIYAGFMAAIIFVAIKFGLNDEMIKETVGLLLSGSLIVALGLVDDYKNLPAKVKLLGQIFAAS
ncbi:MAG: undecaprenyl/decaprenyl-phosphate alpha-N-acetylglucosaminyl 1-phosphate transferase, partial [Selenomonadaceae bacterium]|nr:undecaprenyl/decaprenyl-phosphate alpha-N-acetylglucosaminyl 1-phosphate transferase [Selenomonadaceae bacterium]